MYEGWQFQFPTLYRNALSLYLKQKSIVEQSFKMCQMPFLEEAYHFVSGIPKWEIPGNFEWTVLYRGKSGYRVPGLRKHLNVLSSFWIV